MTSSVDRCARCEPHMRGSHSGNGCVVPDCKCPGFQSYDSTPPDEAAPPKASCGGCRFYRPGPKDGPLAPWRAGEPQPADRVRVDSIGQCRRYAPRPFPTGEPWDWPGLGASELCGEFEWREEPESEDDFQRDLRMKTEALYRTTRTLGPALPPRECPCDAKGRLPTGMKEHLASCGKRPRTETF